MGSISKNVPNCSLKWALLNLSLISFVSPYILWPGRGTMTWAGWPPRGCSIPGHLSYRAWLLVAALLNNGGFLSVSSSYSQPSPQPGRPRGPRQGYTVYIWVQAHRQHCSEQQGLTPAAMREPGGGSAAPRMGAEAEAEEAIEASVGSAAEAAETGPTVTKGKQLQRILSEI